MTTNTIQRVLIIGAGTMGQQIGLQCAMHGYSVTLYDINADKLAGAMAQIRTYAASLSQAGHLTPIRVTETLARIRTETDPEQAADVDLVSESVPEDPDLKGKVFAQFNKLCPPHTIFTTNTSMLTPSMFAAQTGRPAKFAALHFHQDVWESNLADIMPHPGTAPETVETLEEFARSIGQIPVTLHKENPGYVFNTMLGALNRAAIALAANGVADPADIDRAWMAVMKMPIGPMGILDKVGLDTAWHITEYWATKLDDSELQKNADFLKSYLDQGHLGMKSGRGFYEYPDPGFAQPDFLTGENDDAKQADG